MSFWNLLLLSRRLPRIAVYHFPTLSRRRAHSHAAASPFLRERGRTKNHAKHKKHERRGAFSSHVEIQSDGERHPLEDGRLLISPCIIIIIIMHMRHGSSELSADKGLSLGA